MVTDQLASFSAKLRQRLVVEAPTPLDQADVDFVCDILVMRAALLYDLLDGSTQAAELATTWQRTILGLTTLDVELYSRDWKTCREILTSTEFLATISCQAGATRSAFKQQAKGRIHYKWILSATLALMEGTDWFYRVNQWVVFDSRANLTSLDLSSQCCAEYCDFEASLPDPDFWIRELQTMDAGREDRRCHLRGLQRAARDMFGDFRITDYPFRPKHGNGATREVTRQQADSWHKNRNFAVDGDIITYMRYRVSEDEWQDWFYIPYRGLDRTCSLVCVPKSMTVNRTISKEPTTLQYLQQDIAAALDDYFAQHPRCGIDLHSQERSRQLARLGSADGSYATIDLSSASDSVSVALVNVLFTGLPVLYPLMATRSLAVDVKSKDKTIDEHIVMRKFAPMGSATCFPTETMVFATMCEAAVRQSTGRASRVNDFVVYGDDIVIRTEYASAVVALLTEFGFTVNDSKSFGVDDTGDGVHRFREACGIEALDGRDITPLRLSRRLVSLTNNTSDRQAGYGVGMIDLLNRCYLRGFMHLRRWVNDQLIGHKWYRTCLRLSSSDYREFSAAILSHRQSWITAAVPFVITDDLSDTQWRAFRSRSGLKDPLHRCSVLVTVAKPAHAVHPPRDSNDYFSWCLYARDRSVAEDTFVIDDTGVVTIRPRDLKWSKAWVSLQRPAQLRLQVQ
jgi:hypothetical protein